MNPRRIPVVPYSLLAIALLILRPAVAPAQERLPYSTDQLIRLLESGVFSDQRILILTRESCLAFRLDVETENRLKEAGASTSLIAGLRQVCVKLPSVVSSLTIRPDSLDLPLGETRVVRAEALGPDSTAVANVPVQWTSADTTVAVVSMGGAVTGRSLGATRIAASVSEGAADTMAVRVVPARRRAGSGAKSPMTAGLLGVFPGGGEFYAGNALKGGIVLLGAAAGLAAGFLLESTDTVDLRVLNNTGCTGNPCTLTVDTEADIEEKKQLIAGGVVAGVFWLYGLIDGISSVRRSGPGDRTGASAASEGTPVSGAGLGLSLEVAPPDGMRVVGPGSWDLTIVRLRW